MKLMKQYIYIYIVMCLHGDGISFIHITATHLQHPIWVSRAMHSRGSRGQPNVLQCVESFMPEHACCCVWFANLFICGFLPTFKATRAAMPPATPRMSNLLKK